MKTLSLTLAAAAASLILVGAPQALRAQSGSSVTTQELELKKKELELQKAKLEAAQAEQLSVEKAKLDVEAQRLELEKARQELAVQETTAELRMQLSGDVLFDTNEATLKSEAREKLHQVGLILAAYPQGAILITGHTDSRGSETLNLELAKKRAEAVKVWLMNQSGVSEARITARALGEEDPAASNATASGRQLNRRVEITVSKG